jgi:carbonic anhydrase
MAEVSKLVEANRRFASEFAHADADMPPRRRVAVLTCMDARLHPERFLGLDIGDAHVIRNAGGRASDDAIRSLVISNWLLGTREIVVIHHTDCGMLTFTDDELRSKLRDETGADASHIAFLPFDDLEGSVRDDVERIRRSALVPPDAELSGFVYDVRSGELREVVPPTPVAA